MGLVWLLERPNISEASLMVSLQGGFAVRSFASMESLKLLLRLKSTLIPDLLVINSDQFPEAKEILEDLPFPIVFHTYGEYHSMKILSSSGIWELTAPWAEVSACLAHIFQKDISSTDRSKLGALDFHFESLRLIDSVSGEVIDLPPKESRILKILCEQRGRKVSREDIMSAIWPGQHVSSRTLDSHISRLRKRLDDWGLEIDSHYGKGYELSGF